MPRFTFSLCAVQISAVLALALGLSACENRQFSSIFGGKQSTAPAASILPPPPAAVPPVQTTPANPTNPQAQVGIEPPLSFPPNPDAAASGDDRLASPTLPRVHGTVPRVAILLPLSGPSAPIGTAMLNAAELALFQFSDHKFELLPQDTRGTPQGAAEAAQLAIGDGASLILGPLFAADVDGVAAAARAAGINVVAFTNDRRVARDGVFVMGFRPEEQVDRVVKYAFAHGFKRFALLGPDDEYGRTIGAALQATAQQIGAEITSVEAYDPQTADFAPIVRRLADYDHRRANLLAQRQELAARPADDEVAKAALKRLDPLQTLGDVPFDALLIADGGNRLEALAALLPYYDIDPKKTRILGTGLWDGSTIREPALIGAWYAAPSPTARAAFEKQYFDAFASTPQRLATLAYDATALAALFATVDGKMDMAGFTSQQGFAGRDGIFRMRPDGVTERGLAVQQLDPNGGAQVISEAPASFAVPTAPVVNSVTDAVTN